MQWGILTVARAAAAKARMTLPPRHEVIATRGLTCRDCEQWLVQGPHMPHIRPGDIPPDIEMLLTMHWGDTIGDPLRMTARWRGHTFDLVPDWTVATWPDYDTFRQAWDDGA